ncbi:MAG TPA: LacI family DNA-binding transcriptional regulator [Ramlibacter sp.]|uniref:LacI family DNA-binding transcriptional regulator n=1 Tax=Ramlibacter sp. TaxID=1917967 RepID=UPI002CBADBD0|nr:LacI family DNA-binding transcriptional regulator [Ramlibacter sp.]HVZ46349.1 LacI family DNA-binding transcriptional regulator [Ramlibacter sp.]
MALADRPTLSDVAREAGVSVMTVSNVVNGRASVGAELRERVLATIRRLGYRPQQHARGLRLSRSWVVGMLFVMHKPDILTLPWVGAMLSGMSNAFSESGYGLLVDTQSPETLDRSVLLKWRHADGIIAMLSGTPQERAKIWDRFAPGQPVVGIQETLAMRKYGDFASVGQDDHGAALEILQLLLRAGARRIRFIEPDYSWPNMAERSRAGRETMAATRGVEFSVLRCASDNYRAVEEQVRADLQLRGKPDAYMAGNEAIALATLEILQNQGLKVPDDVMVTSFNAFDVWNYVRRPVTTVHFPADAIGAKAAELMLERLAQGKFPQRKFVFAGELRVGDTTRLRVGKQ